MLAVGALLALTACGSADQPGAQPGVSPTTPATSPASTGSPGSTPTEDLPVPSASSTGRGYMTVRGTVSKGVEKGCLVFTPESASSEGTWVLIGNTAGLEPGQTVTISGARRDDMATVCQQGMPFMVEQIVER